MGPEFARKRAAIFMVLTLVFVAIGVGVTVTIEQGRNPSLLDRFTNYFISSGVPIRLLQRKVECTSSMSVMNSI